MRDDHKLTTETHDPTMVDLLSHLQQLRRTVPVNYQLKADLKKKLLEQMALQKAGTSHSEQEVQSLPRWIKRGWIRVTALALAIFITSFVLANYWGGFVAEDIPFPSILSPERAAISAKGDKVALLTNQPAVHTYRIKDKKEGTPFLLPKTSGHYDSVAWANQSDRLAVAENTAEFARLWIVDDVSSPNSVTTRLVREITQGRVLGVQWYPSDQFISYTKEIDGRQEIWLCSTVSFEDKKVVNGSEPAWSPDGKTLAYVDRGNVIILSLQTGQSMELGQGAYPSWESAEKLTFSSSQGSVYEVRMDKQENQPTTVAIKGDKEDKVRRASWTNRGQSLLVIKGNEATLTCTVLSRD